MALLGAAMLVCWHQQPETRRTALSLRSCMASLIGPAPMRASRLPRDEEEADARESTAAIAAGRRGTEPGPGAKDRPDHMLPEPEKSVAVAVAAAAMAVPAALVEPVAVAERAAVAEPAAVPEPAHHYAMPGRILSRAPAPLTRNPMCDGAGGSGSQLSELTRRWLADMAPASRSSGVLTSLWDFFAIWYRT